MKKLALIVLCLAATSAQAQQPWDQIIERCKVAAEAQMYAQTHCATCAGSWAPAALCSVNTYYRGAVPEALTRSCIDRIWDARLRAMACGNCGNPIADTIRCVHGG